jgi:hypothetical protein
MATLFIICDLSGSMVESGKRFIVRNMVRTIDQYFRLQRSQPEIKLVAWSDEAIVAKWQPGQEVPDALLACAGDVSGDSLVAKLDDNQEGYFMMLSDGYWSPSSRKAIGSWSRSLPNGHFRILKIGEDADPRLKGPGVFSAKDLLAALKGWIP